MSQTPEPFVRHGDQLDQFLLNFWQRQIEQAESEPPPYGRHPPLPLARIKKVMKSDPDVRMIASDAPVLFCKACEIFIQEITCRAFLVADAHKRRTISKADIAKALAKSDHFDFLIDVVPRDEAERAKTQKAINSGILEEENRAAAAAEQATTGTTQRQYTGQPTASSGGPPHHQHPQGPAPGQAQGVHPQSSMFSQPPPQSHLAGMSHHMQPPPVHQQQQMPQGSSTMHHPHHNIPHTRPPPPHESLNRPQAPPSQAVRLPPGSQGQGHPGHTHNHSQSSQSQPPPLIPNIRSPTSGSHPHQHPHQHAQHQHQQQQQHGQPQQRNQNGRRASESRMSLSPTIPLSSSRMEPPSSLDMGR